MPVTLTPDQARRFYDRFGAMQDRQGWYEDPALDELAVHGAFQQASRVLEFGCGTGRLAARLLEGPLNADASYLAYELSPVMVSLAAERLAPYGHRARVHQTDGGMDLPPGTGAVDRVVSCYVLDLLADSDIQRFLDEAHRVLAPGGLLCAVSLTVGPTLWSRLVSGAWSLVHRLRPTLVGGCRPLRLADRLDAGRWRLRHRRVVVAWGIASEVMVACPLERKK